MVLALFSIPLVIVSMLLLLCDLYSEREEDEDFGWKRVEYKQRTKKEKLVPAVATGANGTGMISMSSIIASSNVVAYGNDLTDVRIRWYASTDVLLIICELPLACISFLHVDTYLDCYTHWCVLDATIVSSYYRHSSESEGCCSDPGSCKICSGCTRVPVWPQVSTIHTYACNRLCMLA